MPVSWRTSAVLSITCTLAWLLATPALAQRSTPIEIVDPSGAAGDSFGNSVAIDADTMIVGAPGDQSTRGAVHVYRWTGSGWTFEATLTASDAAPGDAFGWSVAISGDTAIVGAPGSDGAAYIFTRSAAAWTQQCKLNAAGGAAGSVFGYSVAISADTAIIGAYQVDVGDNLEQGSAFIFTRSGTTWTQQAQLTAIGGATGDNFGFSVAISGDTAIVGAPSDDRGPNTDQGSASIFTRSGATWTQQAQLTATDGSSFDDFGISVAISGNTAIVGASSDVVEGRLGQGSACVFARSGTTWTQQAQLTAPDGAASDNFGICVAISGNTAIVGAGFDDVGANTNQGSAAIFTRNGTAWTQQTQLFARAGANGDRFGTAVAISGDTAIVGASFDDVGGNADQGSAWVFSRIGSRWIGPDFQLLADTGASEDLFGISVAISGDTAIVGAFFDDVGSNPDQGSAYIFTRSGTTWIQQAQLTAIGGAAYDNFGSSVAISGNTAIVGTPADQIGGSINQGSAYVFTRSGTTWTQQAHLNAAGGATNDRFGDSVAISGDTAIVGAWLDDVGANGDQGSAYVFTRSGSTWTQQAQLNATDGSAGDNFGVSLAISGDTAIVGAPGDNVGQNFNQGSAYVFTRSGSSWTQQARFSAGDGAAGDNFGSSVSLSDDTVIVGARTDNVGQNPDQGSAYVFTRSAGTWTQQAQLIAADAAPFDNFGISVAISGDTAIVGAYFTNFDQGSAYAFTRSGTTWTQQAILTSIGGAAGDLFGICAAISGDTAIIGAPFADVGSNTDRGAAWTFDLPANDFHVARNDATGTSYATLAAALLPALSGHQITATPAAWRSITSLSTLGRSLSLRGSLDIRFPSTAVLELDASSTIGVDPGSVVDVYGRLNVSPAASAQLSADAFTLGSRGLLIARTGSSLTINAPLVDLQGQTRLEQAATLSFTGSATAIGPTTTDPFSLLTVGGTFTNIDTYSTTGGIFNGPLLFNRAAFNVFGVSGVFGSFSNDTSAVTTIHAGTLLVFNSLASNGAIIGAPCASCPDSHSTLDVAGDLTLGSASNLTLPFEDSVIRLGGDFDSAINSNTRYDMSLAILMLVGHTLPQTLEVMSTDIGRNTLGLDRTLEGHFPIGTLHIGPAASTVRLVDAHDNDNLGQSQPEAIYVDTLRIDAGSRLINESNIIYYNTLINDGAVDVPENLRSLTCRADVDGIPGVDFGDFLAFFNCFETEQPCADVDGNPGVDFGDFLAFFNDYDALCS